MNILTHCNAGWLATVDWGTALAPIYAAVAAGISVHVWVDETRPRNQGASLTAWELGQHGVPHTVIVDNAGGHLMQRGLVGARRFGEKSLHRRAAEGLVERVRQGFGELRLCRQQAAAVAGTAGDALKCGMTHGLD